MNPAPDPIWPELRPSPGPHKLQVMTPEDILCAWNGNLDILLGFWDGTRVLGLAAQDLEPPVVRYLLVPISPEQEAQVVQKQLALLDVFQSGPVTVMDWNTKDNTSAFYLPIDAGLIPSEYLPEPGAKVP